MEQLIPWKQNDIWKGSWAPLLVPHDGKSDPGPEVRSKSVSQQQCADRFHCSSACSSASKRTLFPLGKHTSCWLDILSPFSFARLEGNLLSMFSQTLNSALTLLFLTPGLWGCIQSRVLPFMLCLNISDSTGSTFLAQPHTCPIPADLLSDPGWCGCAQSLSQSLPHLPLNYTLNIKNCALNIKKNCSNLTDWLIWTGSWNYPLTELRSYQKLCGLEWWRNYFSLALNQNKTEYFCKKVILKKASCICVRPKIPA